MSDIKLNDQGDIDITDGQASIVEGIDAAVQELAIRLQSFQGDWFLDLNDGIPYIGRIFVKNVNEADVQAIYTAAALKQPSVVSVDRLAITFTPTTDVRRLDLDAAVTFDDSAESVPVSFSQLGLP